MDASSGRRLGVKGNKRGQQALIGESHILGPAFGMSVRPDNIRQAPIFKSKPISRSLDEPDRSVSFTGKMQRHHQVSVRLDRVEHVPKISSIHKSTNPWQRLIMTMQGVGSNNSDFAIRPELLDLIEQGKGHELCPPKSHAANKNRHFSDCGGHTAGSPRT